MPIKEYINKYFEENVEFDYDTETYNATDFWNAWDDISNGMDNGVQWYFEWYYDQPAISTKREEFIKEAVENYIRNNLKSKYTNGAF